LQEGDNNPGRALFSLIPIVVIAWMMMMMIKMMIIIIIIITIAIFSQKLNTVTLIVRDL
jgi:hypothetical protein